MLTVERSSVALVPWLFREAPTLRRWLRALAGAAIARHPPTIPMTLCPKQFDFSKGARGKRYHPGVRLRVPI